MHSFAFCKDPCGCSTENQFERHQSGGRVWFWGEAHAFGAGLLSLMRLAGTLVEMSSGP